MKNMFAVVAVTLLITLVGCADSEPEVESTTVVDTATAVPVTPEPVVTEADTTGPMATEPATEDDATPEGDTAADEDGGMELPKNHNVDKDGIMHAPGSEESTTKCQACHGKDLRGGRSEVSCYDCHEQNWS